MKPYRTVYVHPTSGLHEGTYPGDISVACYLVPCEEIDELQRDIKRYQQIDDARFQGAQAARRGELITSCPYHSAAATPELRDSTLAGVWHNGHDTATRAQLQEEIDRQAAEIERLRADHEFLKKNTIEWFMTEFQVAISGAVSTPEEGYLKDGGLQLMLGDIKLLRKKLDATQSDLAAARRMNEVGVREYQAEKERFRERLDAARREVDEARGLLEEWRKHNLVRESFPSDGSGYISRTASFLARQPAPPEPQVSPSLVEIAQEIERDSDLHRCHGCGGDGYYKGPRLGDTACPECNGTGRKPEPQGAMTGKALYEKWCELTSRKTRWDGTVFKGWEDGWDQLAELVAWKTPQAANALTGEQLRELYRRASGWSEFAAAVERHYRSVAVLAATPEEPRPESVNSAVDSRP